MILHGIPKCAVLIPSHVVFSLLQNNSQFICGMHIQERFDALIARTITSTKLCQLCPCVFLLMVKKFLAGLKRPFEFLTRFDLAEIFLRSKQLLLTHPKMKFKKA